MKISEVTLSIMAGQLREDASELNDDEKQMIEQVMWPAAIQYIKAETGIEGVDEADQNSRRLDDYEDLTVAALCLLSDMYDNRQMAVDKTSANRTVTSILGRYRFNLVPSTEAE